MTAPAATKAAAAEPIHSRDFGVNRRRAPTTRIRQDASTPRTQNRWQVMAIARAATAQYRLNHRRPARNGPYPFMSEYVTVGDCPNWYSRSSKPSWGAKNMASQ